MTENQMMRARGSSMESLRTTVDALQLSQQRTAGAASGLTSAAPVVALRASGTRSSSASSDVDMTVPSPSNSIPSLEVAAAATAVQASPLSRPKRKSAQHAAYMLQHTPLDGTSRKKKQKIRAPLYVVERIMMRRVKNGLYEYLVQWEGYNSDERTWEPEQQIKHTDAYEAWRDAQQLGRLQMLRQMARRTPAEIAAQAAREAMYEDMDPFEFRD
jgi:hypothetical protein